MNIRNVATLLVCASCQFAFGATPDGAIELSPIAVTARHFRTDIRLACPEIDAQLQKSFSSAWARVQRAAIIPVQFRVEGNHVTGTTSSVALNDYRPYVRAAMSKLSCEVAGGEVQDFRFLLVIVDPADRSSVSPLAVAIQGD